MGCLKSKKSKSAVDAGIKQVFASQFDLIKEENTLYKEIDQLFHEHDRDNDLTLDKAEFLIALNDYIKRKQGDEALKERLENFVEQMEIPKRKKFSKDEFRIIMSSVVFEDFTINEMIDLFKTFDKKKDGKICSQEVIHLFKNLGMNISKDIANEMIKEASYGNTEFIDFEEFARAILAK
jgi:Ca2+-binding EF-hand superfamily protein